MFRFADENIFWLLMLIPLMAFVFVVYRLRVSRNISAFGVEKTVKSLMPDRSERRIRRKAMLVMLSVAMIILAAARPQSGSKLTQEKHNGIEIVFVVDVSNSMLADDFKPNRLERTKYAISKILNELPDDMVGVVIFAGDAYTQLPLTSDHSAALNFIADISTDMISRQGTALAKAITHASGSFTSSSENARVMVLISDGENHEGDALAAAKAATDRGIKIYSIGIGTPEGSPINIGGEFIKDEEGKMVVSKLDEQTMQKIAVMSGGAYIRAANHNLGLAEIIEQINKQERKELDVVSFDEYDEYYHYFLWVALAILVVELLIMDRKNHLLASFNIFK